MDRGCVCSPGPAASRLLCEDPLEHRLQPPRPSLLSDPHTSCFQAGPRPAPRGAQAARVLGVAPWDPCGRDWSTQDGQGERGAASAGPGLVLSLPPALPSRLFPGPHTGPRTAALDCQAGSASPAWSCGTSLPCTTQWRGHGRAQDSSVCSPTPAQGPLAQTALPGNPAPRLLPPSRQSGSRCGNSSNFGWRLSSLFLHLPQHQPADLQTSEPPAMEARLCPLQEARLTLGCP